MYFNINREVLLSPLQLVNSVVERKQSIPILSNVLVTLKKEGMTLTATDMEVELIVKVAQEMGMEEVFTLPARKLFDICKALPEASSMQFNLKKDQAEIVSGKSKFILATLPARDFPQIDEINVDINFELTQGTLKKLLEDTMFAMAQQDVRYYLNGLLFEVSNNSLRAVATDGHRLALKEIALSKEIPEKKQVIVPRKAITELMRLLENSEDTMEILIGQNHIRLNIGDIRFTSKLIDGKFPDYERVIPVEEENTIIADREKLRQSLNRASILSNEKYKGIGVQIKNSLLKAHAHNAEQEEAQEEIEIEYGGEEMEIGFNVIYLLDALSAIKTDRVKITIKDPSSSCLILPEEGGQCKYVVMPMRL